MARAAPQAHTHTDTHAHTHTPIGMHVRADGAVRRRETTNARCSLHCHVTCERSAAAVFILTILTLILQRIHHGKHKTFPSHHTKCTHTAPLIAMWALVTDGGGIGGASLNERCGPPRGPPLWSPRRPDTKPTTWSPNLCPLVTSPCLTSMLWCERGGTPAAACDTSTHICRGETGTAPMKTSALTGVHPHVCVSGPCGWSRAQEFYHFKVQSPKEGGEKKGSACEEECESESNPKPRPQPKPSSADVAERGSAWIGVRSSGNLCVEEYVQGEADAHSTTPSYTVTDISLAKPFVKEPALHLISAVSSKLRLQLSQLCIASERAERHDLRQTRGEVGGVRLGEASRRIT